MKQQVLLYGIDENVLDIYRYLIQNNYEVVGLYDAEFLISSDVTIPVDLPIYNAINTIPFHLLYAIIIPSSATNQVAIKTLVDAALNQKVKVFSTHSSQKNKPNNVYEIKPFSVIDLLDRDFVDFNKENILKTLNNKVVLISGAAGSIGSELAKQVILYKPEKIVLLDFAESALYNLLIEIQTLLDATNFIVPVICDIRDYKSLTKVFEKYKPNIVFHAAAYKHVPLMQESPFQAIQTNIFGTKNIADLSAKFNIEKFVFISTDKAVNPTSVMGATKRVAEQYVQLLNKTTNAVFIITRFGNVLGSNGSVIPLFKKQIAQGGPVTVTHQDVIRYFMTISEASLLVLEASALGKGGEVFIFDMGQPIKIVDLAYKMIRLSGYEPEKDIKIQFIGLRPGEKLFEELHTTTSETTKTYHKKIMIAKERAVYDKFIEKLFLLENNLYNEDDPSLISHLQKLVPEFNVKC